LGAGFILPLVSRTLALYADVPIAPLVFSILFLLLIRRAVQAPLVAEGAFCRAGYPPARGDSKHSQPQES
jgi:hypothetical protein